MIDDWLDRDDEKQEIELGKLLWLRTHPGDDRDALLKGYRRRQFYRKRQARWAALRIGMIEEITRCDIGLDFETLLLREIMELLPLAVKRSVLKALLSADGRKIVKAARLVREAQPEVIKKVGREIMV